MASQQILRLHRHVYKRWQGVRSFLIRHAQLESVGSRLGNVWRQEGGLGVVGVKEGRWTVEGGVIGQG